ncbi:adenylyl-sulfate kinase [Pseudotenacibaculum sp. MALMAid0570]|uniref:adenylyl-sulfate kinase n=1 Tax=Pseudotenacibaculum sp. MALMAid0570 TaxID=3143938 RepID=UPI0032DE334A
MQENITRHNYKVNRLNRCLLKSHESKLLWFTGLSGSGKSTIANKVELLLHENEIHTYTLDGDNIRSGINKDLSFSPEDRKENIRRVAEISNLMIDAGLVVLAAFISPYRKDRERIKEIVGKENMIEIYINTSLEVCEKRDVKGLYKKARLGEIKNMTGISSAYEIPLNPDIEIKTEEMSVEEAASKILQFLKLKKDKKDE